MEPTGQHSENSEETIANPVLNGYIKTRNLWKTLLKTKKKQSTETKRRVNIEIQARYGPSFYIYFGKGAATCQLCH